MNIYEVVFWYGIVAFALSLCRSVELYYLEKKADAALIGYLIFTFFNGLLVLLFHKSKVLKKYANWFQTPTAADPSVLLKMMSIEENQLLIEAPLEKNQEIADATFEEMKEPSIIISNKA